MTRLNGFVKKGWGHEFIFASNDKYCGKLLSFKAGSKFSMHFHKEKMETWLCLNGKFKVMKISTEDASVATVDLKEGDVYHNDPCEPHQVSCVEAGILIEVSTPDSVEDNYRIAKGDSQK
jgi:mannose-6-phosphate isomerase-like protein (cupin superfamily)|tara:strand:- start:2744 stop:3103 length:360 start_codon:yes stop_codon:yes gene_type:complete